MSENNKTHLYQPFVIKHPTKKMVAEAKMNSKILRNLKQRARELGEIARQMVLELVDERGKNA